MKKDQKVKQYDDETVADRERLSRSRVRIDPSERDDYSEWVEERRQRGRKKRHSGERSHHRRHEDDDF